MNFEEEKPMKDRNLSLPKMKAQNRALTSGEGEIRTREELAFLAVFKTAALVHYATSPSVYEENSPATETTSPKIL